MADHPPAPVALDEPRFYVCDYRTDWMPGRKPYVTFWGPDSCGYAYPLPWSGRYTAGELKCGYHWHMEEYSSRPPRRGQFIADKLKRPRWERWPVPVEVVEAIGIEPAPRMIDGNVGPVLPNTAEIRNKLLAARLAEPPKQEAAHGQ